MEAGKIAVAVIGLGMGYEHLKAYAGNSHTEIVGICDTDAQILARCKVECVLNDRSVSVDVYEGARTVAACEAAVASAKTGKPVNVQQVK